MQQLDALAREAAALAAGAPPASAAESEVARQMQICNACRYCEGFCAVFPAMTRRLEFGKADVHYLANLCHNCGACLHACQYAPPHEFAVNVPQAMAVLRGQTYADYAWPPALGALYRRNGLTVALATAGGLALFLVLLLWMRGALFHAPLAGNFYAVFPHNTLVAMFGAVFAFAVLALGMGVSRFWRGQDPGRTDGAATEPGAGLEAAKSALTLRYLDAATGRAATKPTMPSRWRGGAFTMSPSMASCSVSLPRRSRRCTTTSWACRRRMHSAACRSCSEHWAASALWSGRPDCCG